MGILATYTTIVATLLQASFWQRLKTDWEIFLKARFNSIIDPTFVNQSLARDMSENNS